MGYRSQKLRSDTLDNRSRILEAAQQVFAAQGVDAPVRAISRQAGLAPATLYRHFPNKQTLAAEAFRERMDACQTILDDGLASIGRSGAVSSPSMESNRRERERQAEAHGLQAIELRLRGRAAEAKRHADAGIELLDGLLAGRPDHRPTQYVLAGQLYNRAAIFEQLGQPSAGIPDARRSVDLYRELADAVPAAVSQGADAQLRLARLMAQDTATGLFVRDAPYDLDAPGTARDVRRTGSAALDTYERLAQAGQASSSDLARARWSWAEVLRLLTTEPPVEVLSAYAFALEASYAIGAGLTPEDRQRRAQALSAAVRLQRALDDEIIDLRSAANAAVEEWWTLTVEGHGTHAPCLAAVHDLAMLARESGAADSRDILLMGQAVLDAMTRPLDPESAAIAAEIATLLHEG